MIADGGAGLNIKGSRYELWCATRELGLRCATVCIQSSLIQQLYIACPSTLCHAWNTRRRERGEPSYTDIWYVHASYTPVLMNSYTALRSPRLRLVGIDPSLPLRPQVLLMHQNAFPHRWMGSGRPSHRPRSSRPRPLPLSAKKRPTIASSFSTQ